MVERLIRRPKKFPWKYYSLFFIASISYTFGPSLVCEVNPSGFSYLYFHCELHLTESMSHGLRYLLLCLEKRLPFFILYLSSEGFGGLNKEKWGYLIVHIFTPPSATRNPWISIFCKIFIKHLWEIFLPNRACLYGAFNLDIYLLTSWRWRSIIKRF